MRIVCVICTELIVLNSRISAVHCGHIFHEDCLFKWLDSGQKTCPQCRSTATSKTIVKKLYLTPADTQSTFNSDNLTLTQASHQNENLLNEIEALRDELNQCRSSLKSKNEILEQKEKKIEDLNGTLANSKKNLAENKLLLDYLKKEIS
jgi:TRAF-interacting protein